MRELVQEPPMLHLGHFAHDIPIPTAARRGHDILVEGKRDEDDDDEQVDDGADGAHRLGDLLAIALREVLPLEAGAHECRAQPADHGVGRGKRNAAKGERGDERLAIFAREGLEQEREAEDAEGEVGERFAQRETGGVAVGGWGRRRFHGAGLAGRCISGSGWAIELGWW
ncbi:hypothetical protein DSL72_002242 [Monilinia vaccinii-corymbosi]|uniref:Uncharacterized protein n=1 Tax=Monilinia vaccinii-corymbosi TaxID=61207 RepID=A0A8A3PC48_9HELO|nr:hypothetical protein DSL72_002242 [Monilinia vaccinii-corymbosi]